MNKIFICTNIIQLIRYKLYLCNQNIGNVYVFVVNPYLNNKKSIKIIKNFTKKIGFIFCYKIKKNLKNESVELISREPLNFVEINFVNQFKINKWVVVEDGLGDYIINYKYPFFYKLPYLLIKLFEVFISKIRLIYNFFFKRKKRFFNYKYKEKLPLVCQKKSLMRDFKKINNFNNNKFTKYKLIILGSIYNFSTKGFIPIYNCMTKKINEDKIPNSSILYVPHPRSDEQTIKKIKNNYKWSVLNKSISAEELLSISIKPQIWSSSSSSIIYAHKIYNFDCTIFSLNKFKYYFSLARYVKEFSIKFFFNFLGAKVININ